MRIILFKTPIEALNHFVDELNVQFVAMGHQTLVSDVCSLNAKQLLDFCVQKVDVALCYDGFAALDKEICERLDIPFVSIYVDHPMSFYKNFEALPEKYVAFFVDENHVTYMKKNFGVENSFFLPHMASINQKINMISLEKKDISVLFSANYRDVNSIYREINERFGNSKWNKIVMQMLECLIENTWLTVEEALEQCLLQNHIRVSNDFMAYVLQHTKLVDHFIRMYYRNKVVDTVVKADIPITLVGAEWDKTPYANMPNVSIMKACKFAEVFYYMERARVTLNVMPWFKEGTHERIFNALLHGSCPLTDESAWLTNNFLPDKECAYFSLMHLGDLPDKVCGLLENDVLCEGIILHGREKVRNCFTSKHIAEMVLDKVRMLF